MAFDIMFRQLLPGMGASVSIFVLTLLFFSSIGTFSGICENV